MSIKITKFEIQTQDGKKVALTPDEARELYAQLHELFGSKTVYVPGAPIYIERYPRPWTFHSDSSAGIARATYFGPSGIKLYADGSEGES